MTGTQGDLTLLLEQAAHGSDQAVNELLPLVYDELRRMAAGVLRSERAGHTLPPTALVHEAYLKLVKQHTAGWKNRDQFFGVASTAMRRILTDYARMRRAAKRGGDRTPTPFDDVVVEWEEKAHDLVALDDALSELAVKDERKSRVVELRFFGGCTAEETSRILDVPLRTINRDWATAKAWLYARIVEP